MIKSTIDKYGASKGSYIYDTHKKMTNCVAPPIPNSQNWTIDLSCKNNKIRKHVTNDPPLPPFHVDVINV